MWMRTSSDVDAVVLLLMRLQQMLHLVFLRNKKERKSPVLGLASISCSDSSLVGCNGFNGRGWSKKSKLKKRLPRRNIYSSIST
jgi:hypothetical protein